ncbi:MAG: hypothetical protein HYX54_08115 [Chloroflexi bacterium]|nr:hypothetical protein [Chloroflexota bacterium]
MIDRVPAMGGVRTVPAPDPVARDYLLLALRLDQHRPGLVDAYFGPADLKASADMDALRSPGRLALDAVALRHRLPAEVEDAERRAWLDAQLVALEAQARASAGETIPYETLVTRWLDLVPAADQPARFARFARLLAEARAPSAIEAELGPRLPTATF